MPWKASDAEGFTKAADTPKKQALWAKVANRRLRRCLADIEGKPSEQQHKSCEKSAIKAANGFVANVKEADMPSNGLEHIAQAALETAFALVRETGEITRERAEKMLCALEADLKEVAGDNGRGVVDCATFEVGGERVTLDELIAAYQQQWLSEPYPNEHACRVRNPGDFQPDSFRSKTLPKSEGGKGGVRIVLGRLKGETTSTAQAYRFPVSLYSAAEAKAWLKENDVKCKTFEAATGEVEPCDCADLGEIIRKEGNEIVLYDSEGEKVLQRFPFGEGEKYDSEETARTAAEKRERQIQFFKHREADTVAQVRDLLHRAMGLIEVEGNLYDVASDVEDAFNRAFEPDTSWRDGPARLSSVKVFDGDPSLGTSIIVKDREEGKAYAVAYEKGEDGITFAPRAEWKEVVVAYKFVAAPASEALHSDALAVQARDATAAETAALSEAEAAVVQAGRRAPVVIDFRMIEPGPGNQRDNHYYPPDMLERDAHVFKGVDVFATDHVEKERTERTKVGKVLDVPTRFTETRAPVASVLVYDPYQAEKARNRNDAKELGTLHCSIFGSGKAKEGEVDGKKYNVVQELTQGHYLEFVSQAGAGGQALALAESYDGGGAMPNQEGTNAAPVEDEVQEVEIEEAEGEGAPVETPPEDTAPEGDEAPAGEPEGGDGEPAGDEAAPTGEEVEAAVKAANLPPLMAELLTQRTYASKAVLSEAVDKAVAEVKRLTKAGQVSGLGESQQPGQGGGEADTAALAEQSKAGFNEIMKRHGLKEV